MTKDFKMQAASQSAFGQYGLGWLAGGVAIGLLIGLGMYWLNKQDTPVAASTTAAPSPVTAQAAPATPTATSAGDVAQPSTPAAAVEEVQADNATPGFSYHAVLPQLEIDVPVAMVQQGEATKPAADAKPNAQANAAPAKAADAPPSEEKAAVQPIPTGFNGFQVGSYKTADQANAMQGRLKRNGLETRVEQATIKGETWYRVRLGPAPSPQVMQQWQQKLFAMGISPLAVRM